MSVIDRQTGEIIKDIQFGDKLVKRKSKSPFDLLNKTSDSFVKMNVNYYSLEQFLSMSQIGFLTVITKYICYQDKALRSNGHNNGKLLNAVDLSRLIGISERTIRRYLETLEQNNILKSSRLYDKDDIKKSCRAIIINPYLYNKGNIYRYIWSLFDT